MTVAKNGQQATGLLAHMRPETGTPTPAAEPPQIPRRADDIIVKTDPPPAPRAAPTPPAPPPKPASPWATLLGNKP